MIGSLILAFTLAASSQPPKQATSGTLAPPDLKPTRLTLRPAPPPDPALKYQLLPELLDQRPGNAAYHYQRAHSPEWMTYRREKEFGQNLETWLYKTALKDLPREQVARVLSHGMLREVDLAARREHCDWELTERFKKEGFGLLLPDMQWFREVANLLSLRARLELAEGRLDRALYTVQTGLALSRHLSDTPTLITHLIGLAVGQVMLNRLEEVLQQPNAPNLYWALTDLPRPLHDLRKAMAGEKALMETLLETMLGMRPERETVATMLGLRPPAQEGIPRRLSPDQLQTMVDDLYHLAALVREGSAADLGRFTNPVAAVRLYPQARVNLIAAGMKAEAVDALPVLQVVALDSLTVYRRHRDEAAKWLHFPYWEARAPLERAEQRFQEVRQQQECLPAFLELRPAVIQVHFAGVRTERRLAVLRAIEALRLHAAAHGGNLPGSWGDIQAVPIPLDPITGKDFVLQVTGNKAILFGPPPPGQVAAAHTTVYYEITLER